MPEQTRSLDEDMPEQTRSLDEDMPEQTRSLDELKLLPKDLYCGGCGECLVGNLRGSFQTAGWQDNCLSLGVDKYEPYSAEDIYDEAITESNITMYSCGGCGEDIEDMDSTVKWITLLTSKISEYPFGGIFNYPSRNQLGEYSSAHFRPEILDYVDKLVDFEDILPFQRSHALYRRDQDQTEETGSEEETAPEDQEAIIGGHHQRWQRGLRSIQSFKCKDCSEVIVLEQDTSDSIICQNCHTIQKSY